MASQYLDKAHWADVRVKRSTFELCETPNQHLELISAQDGEGQTALHKAASAEHVVMPVASGYLTCDQNLTAVSIQDDHDARKHQTFWTDARVKRSLIHDELSSKTSIEQQTALYEAVCTHAINAILMYLTPDQQLSVISIQDHKALTVLHQAVERGDNKIIRALFDGLNPEQKLVASAIKDSTGRTIIKIASDRDHHETVAVILDKLCPEHIDELISEENTKSIVISLSKANHYLHEKVADTQVLEKCSHSSGKSAG